MATKKNTKSAKRDTKVLTNGALALVIALSTMIGALAGWLVAYLTIR